jgi:hypothetical protein
VSVSRDMKDELVLIVKLAGDQCVQKEKSWCGL